MPLSVCRLQCSLYLGAGWTNSSKELSASFPSRRQVRKFRLEIRSGLVEAEEQRSREPVAPASGLAAASGRPVSIRPPRRCYPHRAVVVVRLLKIELGGVFVSSLNGDSEESWVKETQEVERTVGFHMGDLSPKDRRLVTEEVAGVIRWKKYLDYVICSYYTRGIEEYESLEPLLKQILRLGVYELLFSRIRSHAAIYEAVALATSALRPDAGKLVNAILRSLQRSLAKNEQPMPPLTGDQRSQERALAIIHSHPNWMVRRWMSRYGRKDAIKLLEWNNGRPFYGVRANLATGTSQDDLAGELEKLELPYIKSPYLNDFLRVSAGVQALVRHGYVQQGLCTIQDESAGLVVSLLDPRPYDLVIDCCAAPGGKTFYIAALLQGKGRVIAADINRYRLLLLQKAAVAARVYERVKTFCVDARDMRKFSFVEGEAALATKVLVDVPCSGLGVLCKRPDLRWRRGIEDIEDLTVLQDQILDGAAKMVRPGGLLVYSTCTIEPEENEERVASFLSRNKEFTLESAEGFVPKEMVTPEGYFQSLPHVHGIDGAFAARLRRRKKEAIEHSVL